MTGRRFEINPIHYMETFGLHLTSYILLLTSYRFEINPIHYMETLLSAEALQALVTACSRPSCNTSTVCVTV